MNQRYDVIVIGGGHNGLTSAALFAKAGRRVLVLERAETFGGLASGDEFHPGYQSAGLLFDTTGVRPSVVAELELAKHGLTRTDTPPPVFAPQTEGPGLLLHHDATRAAEELRAHSADDAVGYAEYRSFLARFRDVATRLLDELPPAPTDTSPTALLKLAKTGLSLRKLGKRDMFEVLRVLPMSVEDWLREWFESEPVLTTLAATALHGTFTGPRSPASAALLVRAEILAGGAVVGGPSALIRALGSAAREHGVTLRTQAEVTAIRLEGGRAVGVTLADGESIDAELIAASCDPKRTFLGLLPQNVLSRRHEHNIDAYRSKGTAAKLDLALSSPLRFSCRPDLEIEHARIAPSLTAMEKAFDAVKYGRFSEEPILDLYVPSASDPGHAPEGHASVSATVHFAPYDHDGGWTDEARARLEWAAINVLERYAPGIRDSIVASRLMTPVDLETRYGVTGGHMHHGEHGLDQLLVRPIPEAARYRTAIPGLLLSGSGSHPGGGLTCAPGSLATTAILGTQKKKAKAAGTT